MNRNLADDVESSFRNLGIRQNTELEFGSLPRETCAGIYIDVLTDKSEKPKDIYISMPVGLPEASNDKSSQEKRYEAILNLIRKNIVDPLVKKGYQIKFNPKPLSENHLQSLAYAGGRI